MSKHFHLEDGFQSTVVLLLEDYIAVKVSYERLGDGERGIPDALMIFDALESHRLAAALITASMRLAGVDVDFPACARCKCRDNSWWSSESEEEELE